MSARRNILSGFIRTIRSSLPAACIVCGQASCRDYSLCRACEDSLPRQDEDCQRCGVALANLPSQEPCCNRCLLKPPLFDLCRAAFPYTTPVDKLVASFKFSARFDVGYSLSRVLARTFNAHYGEGGKPQLLLPVPLHRQRLQSRGFNQAGEICKVLSRQCGVASADSVLIKTRNTQAQTAMNSATARRSNLRGAFALGKLDCLQAVTHIALVDDVVTTMATTETLARLLRSQLHCRIDVWCLARANR